MNPFDQIGIVPDTGQDLNSTAIGDSDDDLVMGTDLADRLVHELTHAILDLSGLSALLQTLSRNWLVKLCKTQDFVRRWTPDYPQLDLEERLVNLSENIYRLIADLNLRTSYTITPGQQQYKQWLIWNRILGNPLQQDPEFPPPRGVRPGAQR
jgi:hypothetical protein